MGMTERNCMKVVGKLSELNLLMPSGKRSMMNGARGQLRDFPSGLVRDPAKRQEILNLLKEKKKVVKMQQWKKKRKRRKKKKRRKRKKSKLSKNAVTSKF